jgi:hypothetical protein
MIYTDETSSARHAETWDYNHGAVSAKSNSGITGECRLGTRLLHSLAKSAQSLQLASEPCLPVASCRRAADRHRVPGSSSCIHTQNQHNRYLSNHRPASCEGTGA